MVVSPLKSSSSPTSPRIALTLALCCSILLLFCTGEAHAQNNDDNNNNNNNNIRPGSSSPRPSMKVVQVDIENYGTVDLSIRIDGELEEPTALPGINITSARVRSKTATTCVFHKWPVKGFPDDDGRFLSWPIRSDDVDDDDSRPAAGEEEEEEDGSRQRQGGRRLQFKRFRGAQRLFCYDSTAEWAGEDTTLFLQLPGESPSYRLEHVTRNLSRPGSPQILDFERDERYPDDAISVEGMAVLYPYRREALCRYYPVNDYRRFPVAFGRTIEMDPSLPIRRFECHDEY